MILITERVCPHCKRTGIIYDDSVERATICICGHYQYWDKLADGCDLRVGEPHWRKGCERNLERVRGCEGVDCLSCKRKVCVYDEEIEGLEVTK